MSPLRIIQFKIMIMQDRYKSMAKKVVSMRDGQASDVMRRYEPSEEEMKRVFFKISNNKDKISLQDLKQMLHKFEICHANEEAKQIMWAADVNKDGVIDLADFLEVNKKAGVSVGEIKSAFRRFDQDRDGRISASEIKRMMDRLGENCSLEDCRLMVKNVDRNGDDLIDMDEFMEMMTSNMNQV